MHPVTAFVARRSADLVMIFMAISAIGKFVDLPAFRLSLATWGIAPGFDSILAIAVPAIELLFAGLWFSGQHQRLSLISTTMLIAAYSIAYAAFYLRGRPPTCNCLGMIERFAYLHRLSEHLLLRNTVLVALALFGILGSRRSVHTLRTSTSPPLTDHQLSISRSRAFTLIELMVLIAVIALLVGLVVVSLAPVRTTARDAVSLNNLRSHAQIFSLYEGDNREYYPYYTRPTIEITNILIPRTPSSYPVMYFWGYKFWNYVLYDAYYGGNPYHDSLYPPTYFDTITSPSQRGGPTPYIYNCTFLADPAYWNPRLRTGLSQWRAVRPAEVVFPSKKVLLLNEHHPFQPANQVANVQQVWQAALSDGAAIALPANRFARGYPAGDGPEMMPVHSLDYEPGQHTLDGARGRDIP